MNSHRNVAITDAELAQWAATRADDAGRLARELVQRRSEIVNLVTAAREFWDTRNDLSEESAALDKALEPFSSKVPYADNPDTPTPAPREATPPQPDTFREEVMKVLTDVQEWFAHISDDNNIVDAAEEADLMAYVQIVVSDLLARIGEERS